MESVTPGAQMTRTMWPWAQAFEWWPTQSCPQVPLTMKHRGIGPAPTGESNAAQPLAARGSTVEECSLPSQCGGHENRLGDL